ncbi:venom serine protease [Lucilia sericata]|uniref:venom serine protease n=1 Tax=Lucilia sericata TaxID=13632 RepID=UPI0018A81A3F|nr:venom serine protease [Lucilia sericata]
MSFSKMLSNDPIVTRILKAFCFLFAFSYFAVSTEAALFDGCDHTYTIAGGYSYLESPYYPNSYPKGSSCRYKFVAPLDYDIVVNCTINLAKGSSGCTTEYFYLARDGDVLLRGSEKFCGAGTFIRRSVFRSVVLAYESGGGTGNFRCQLYAAPQPCDCGWSVNTKIVNGQQTATNEFPSMVALKDRTTNQASYCGGAIVSHRYVLTAAHCARVQTNPANILIRAGRQNLLANPDTMYAADYYVSQIIVHGSYTANPVNNDIALLVTTTNIEWSRGVGPICLPSDANANNNFAYNYVDVIGWGTTSFAGPTSSTLLKVHLMVQSNSACQQAYQGITTIYPSQMCTYDTTGTNKDSCQFDSGGPAVYKYNRQFILGIISFGKGCGQGGYATGVNTRVTSYLSWIKQNTGYSTCNVSM